MDPNEEFDPDRVYEAVVWRHAPWWVIVVEPVGAAQTFWWADVEYTARDLIECTFELDDPDVIRLDVVRGIGPVQDRPERSPRVWFWAFVGGLLDRRARRRSEHDGPSRLWVLERGQWLGPSSRTGRPNPLVFRGGDEYGNRTVALRLPFGAALVLSTTVPLRREPFGATEPPESPSQS